MPILVVFYVCAGLLLMGLSIPLMLRRIKPNPWYGFRLRQTLDDAELWYRVNAYAGRWLFGAGLLTAAVSAALALIPGINLDTYAIACMVIVFSVLGIGFYRSYRYMLGVGKRG